VDNFLRHTQINTFLEVGIMEFVPYDQFKDVEFIAEGGYSKVYKANWDNGCIKCWDNKRRSFRRSGFEIVALKKLNNSEHITFKELKEVYVLISL